jgi:hypothetical protein
VFLVNSRPGLVTATSFEEALLLPKLQSYFAEFLRESYLAPLGILYLPTCVGFRYRYPFVEGRSSFSWEYDVGCPACCLSFYFLTPRWNSDIGSRYFLYPVLTPLFQGHLLTLNRKTIIKTANLAYSVPRDQQRVVQEY